MHTEWLQNPQLWLSGVSVKWFLIRSICVFLAMIVLDAFWNLWMRRTSQGKHQSAAFFSAMIVLLTVFLTRSYMQSAYYAIPAALGAYVGTHFAIKLDVLRSKKNNAPGSDP